MNDFNNEELRTKIDFQSSPRPQPIPSQHPEEVPRPDLQPISPQHLNQSLNNIKELGNPNILQTNDNIFFLTIIGQIEGHQILTAQSKATKYEHVIPQLIAVEQNPKIEGVLVILNTSGGDVEAGLAISELISSLSKPTVSLVLGGGHSIGIPIAVSCTQSIISPTGTMTVHPIRYTGLVINGHQQFEYLQKMQDRVVEFVCSHSEIDEKMFQYLMFKTGELAQDIGTILVGKEAVDVGLINDVGGLSQAFETLNKLIEESRKKKNIESLN